MLVKVNASRNILKVLLSRESGSERSIAQSMSIGPIKSFADCLVNPFHLPSKRGGSQFCVCWPLLKLLLCVNNSCAVRFHFQLPALSLFGADPDILSNRSGSLHRNINRAAGLLLLVRGKVGRPLRQKRSKGLSPASHWAHKTLPAV
jgi:hypothetical protein